jgi:hypothetical protein
MTKSAPVVLGMVLGFALGAGHVMAAELRVLSGAEIETALDGRKLQYEGAHQTFFASGRTEYNNGRPAWGYWRIQGDQYCSQWPPADGWECYDVELSADGTVVAFVAGTGHRSEGRYVEEE